MGLTSGQLAARGGVNVESIRFYEREGLLPKPPRSRSGYRHFPDEAVQRIRFIKRSQELGFTLREIKELLELRDDASCASVRKHAEAKLDDIDAKIADLKKMRRALARLVAECPNSGTTRECPILNCLDSKSSAARGTANPVREYRP